LIARSPTITSGARVGSPVTLCTQRRGTCSPRTTAAATARGTAAAPPNSRAHGAPASASAPGTWPLETSTTACREPLRNEALSFATTTYVA